MSIIMNELNNQGYFKMKVNKDIVEECVLKFLVERCDVKRFIDKNLLEEDETIEDFLYDAISLGINDGDDVCIKFHIDIPKLEKQLIIDDLITEGESFRATNLCISAIAHDLQVNTTGIDVWKDYSFDYFLIQLPFRIIK